MNAGRAFAIVLRQGYLMRGSPARVLPLFAWVAVDIVLWGFITKYLDQVTSQSLHFATSLLGAVLIWDFFVRVLHGVTTAFLEDVWSRNFLNLFASPITIPEYLSGLVLTSILTSLVGLAVMLVLASALFGLQFFAYGAAAVPFLMILFAFGIALGIAGSALVLRFGPASEWFIWPAPALISPFVGVFYPLSTLPDWMRAVAHALPPSYVFENLRAIMAGDPFRPWDLAGGGVLAVVYIALACVVFGRVHRQAVRTGLIARYSAESVT